jgi:predicted DNA-binding transcriptional regulator AlpA
MTQARASPTDAPALDARIDIASLAAARPAGPSSPSPGLHRGNHTRLRSLAVAGCSVGEHRGSPEPGALSRDEVVGQDRSHAMMTPMRNGRMLGESFPTFRGSRWTSGAARRDDERSDDDGSYPPADRRHADPHDLENSGRPGTLRRVPMSHTNIRLRSPAASIQDGNHRTNELLSQRQVAVRLGVSARTIEGWRARGVGPPFLRLSARAVRYRSSDLEHWLDQRRVADGPGHEEVLDGRTVGRRFV